MINVLENQWLSVTYKLTHGMFICETFSFTLGAFMGNGEGAVASNIVDLTHRIQRWDFNQCRIPDITSSRLFYVNKNELRPTKINH